EDGIRDSSVTGVQTCALPIFEYFVEWSFDQSIGPRTTPQAQFSDVPMAAPAKNAHPLLEPASRRMVIAVGGGLFAAGLLVGAARSEERRVGEEWRCGWSAACE